MCTNSLERALSYPTHRGAGRVAKPKPPLAQSQQPYHIWPGMDTPATVMLGCPNGSSTNEHGVVQFLEEKERGRGSSAPDGTGSPIGWRHGDGEEAGKGQLVRICGCEK